MPLEELEIVSVESAITYLAADRSPSRNRSADELGSHDAGL